MKARGHASHGDVILRRGGAALVALLAVLSGCSASTSEDSASTGTVEPLDIAFDAGTSYTARVSVLSGDDTGVPPVQALDDGSGAGGSGKLTLRSATPNAVHATHVVPTVSTNGPSGIDVLWTPIVGAVAYELEVLDDTETQLSVVIPSERHCDSSSCRVELIDKAERNGRPRPDVSISAAVPPPGTDDVLSLDGGDTVGANGEPMSFEWRVGGEKKPFSRKPVALAPKLKAGKYRIHLRVADEFGVTTSRSVWIEVAGTGTQSFVDTPTNIDEPLEAKREGIEQPATPAPVPSVAPLSVPDTTPATVPAPSSPAVAETSSPVPVTTTEAPAALASAPVLAPGPVTVVPAPEVPIDSTGTSGSLPDIAAAEPVSTSVPEPEAAESTVELAPEPGSESPTEPGPAPVSVPDVEPASAPVVEPAAEPVVEPAAAPVAEPVAEPATAPVVEPVVEPVAASGAEAAPTDEPVPGTAVVAEPAPVDVAPAPSVDDRTPPVIEDLAVVNIAPTSITVQWTLDEYATGRIDYGTDDELGLSGVDETRFKWKTHRQSIDNLAPDTRYRFVVRSSDEHGNEVVSAMQTVTTARNPEAPSSTIVAEVEGGAPPSGSTVPAPAPSANAWPTSTDDRLPMGGVFYGNPKGGLMSGNSTIAVENAIRFRAERSGSVDAVRYNNRTLTDKNIQGRCEQYGPGSLWCDCVDAGLDRFTCGYTLGNPYSVGNGGLITIEIQEDDGSAKHLPSGRALARSAQYVPMNIPKFWPTIELLEPVELVAGRIYHIVFRNAAPPSRCRLRRQPVDQAYNCPRDEGAIGMNGTWHGTDPSSESRFGPFRGRLGVGSLVRQQVGGSWSERADAAPFYEMRYVDGEYVGDSYAGYDNLNYGGKTGTRTLEGSQRGRQVFTVADGSREANGLWLQFGHVYKRSISGAPLTVQVKDAAGSVLASGTIAASPECNRIAREAWPNGARRDWMCRTWGYTDLDRTVNLLEGSTYSVEFSAPAGAGFDLSSFFSAAKLPERNIWDDAHAEYSSNGGGSWVGWGTNYRSDRDLAVMFTLVGMPKRLP